MSAASARLARGITRVALRLALDFLGQFERDALEFLLLADLGLGGKPLCFEAAMLHLFGLTLCAFCRLDRLALLAQMFLLDEPLLALLKDALPLGLSGHDAWIVFGRTLLVTLEQSPFRLVRRAAAFEDVLFPI